MKLIVGLGNPDKKYELTRHNVGFIIINIICKELKLKLNKIEFNGNYVKILINNIDVIFLKPLSFMNLSGICISNFINYFKIKTENLLIIHDEIDLSFGRIQFKQNFSSAGHNGIKSIFNQIGNKNLKRMRIGIGKNKDFPNFNWVLSNFSEKELNDLNNLKNIFVESINNFIIGDNFEKIMNKYNKKNYLKH